MMMNGLRRGVSAIAPQMRSGLQHNVRMGVVVSRHMVDLATKEQGEEVSYIRRQEHERKARLRAQMEEILAREQHDEEHQALVNVIGNILILYICITNCLSRVQEDES